MKLDAYSDLAPENISILDFGAGNGRHSTALRNRGYSVYSYDPYNGSEHADPYSETSSVLPNETFDVVLSAFVLNVVSYENMLDILRSMESYAKPDGYVVHIVREDLRNLRGGSKRGKHGSIQRDIPIKELTDLGYSRVGKLFVKEGSWSVSVT